jgi:hypothetical protein
VYASITVESDLHHNAGVRNTTILPAMTLAEPLETTRIHRVAGLTGERTALVTTRPFRAPQHTISDVGRVGGGHVPMPGDVSMAPNGVPCEIDAVRVNRPLEAIFDDLTLEWTLAKFKPASRYTSRNAWSDQPARPHAVRGTPLSPRPDSRQHRP